MIVQTKSLSDMIVAIANAGAVAIQQLSTAENPVGLSEFSVELKYSCALDFSSTTNIGVTYYALSVDEKIKCDYKEELAMTVKLIIKPLPKKEEQSS